MYVSIFTAYSGRSRPDKVHGPLSHLQAIRTAGVYASESLTFVCRRVSTTHGEHADYVSLLGENTRSSILMATSVVSVDQFAWRCT